MFKLMLPLIFFCFYGFVESVGWSVCVSGFCALSLFSLSFVFQPFSLVFSPCSWACITFVGGPLIVLTLWVSGLMVMASFNLFKGGSFKGVVFWVIVLCGVLVVTFSVSNLLLFYIFFEVSLIPTLILILGWGYQPERFQAGIYLMMYTICASLPLLLSILLYFSFSGHMSFFFSGVGMFGGAIWWFFFMFAFLVKMPMYTTHLWLPKAHVEAPVAGSMILAGVLLKLGGYGILQVMFFFPSPSMPLSAIIMCVSMWGAIGTGMICMRQSDIKSLIAYSSVGHMGLVICGAMSNTSWGFYGCVVMMVAHGICSPALFALANMTYEGTNTRSLYLCKGLLMLFPSLSFWWFIFSAANMAAPPSINLLGELVLFTSILSQAQGFSVLLGACSFLAGAYSLLLYTATQHGTNPSFSNPTHLFSPRNYSTLMLHALPLLLLILKADTLFSP